MAYNAHRVFITYGGGSVVKNGLLGKIEKSLQDAGLFTQAKGGVKPNPRLSWVREAIQEAISFKADFILAIGGGSVIDSAKAVAHGTANPEIDVWSFWNGTAKLTQSLPVGAVLTLSAAGSETSDSAVITNEETGKKAGLNTPFNRPALAFMNPELTYTIPKKQLICGTSDILMHTLERYFTSVKEENALTDRIAEALMVTVIDATRRAIKDQTDYDAMSEIMWAGSVSHCGLTELGRCKDFACHKLGHELSGRFDVTHGASLTAVWGAWANYVYRDDIPRFAQFAAKIWGITEGSEEERAKAGIEATIAYFKEIGMPVNFTELGIGVQSDDVLEALADSCTAGGTKVVANFHPIDKQTAIAIYRLANQ
jgi:alcohol dehydrogenase YqhD (iron-dependent ADH family)